MLVDYFWTLKGNVSELYSRKLIFKNISSKLTDDGISNTVQLAENNILARKHLRKYEKYIFKISEKYI